jgi:hypothetical protein
MEYKKLFFSEEDKAEIKRLREELKNIVVDQEVLSQAIAGNQGVVGCGPTCGEHCTVTCSFYCEPKCESNCAVTCHFLCWGTCSDMCNGLLFLNSDPWDPQV